MSNRVSANFPASIKNRAISFFHLLVCVINFYTLWYDQNYVNVKLPEALNGFPLKSRILYLTMWNLVLQTVYMGLAFLNDVVGTNEQSPSKTPAIRYIKDALFGTAYPSAMFVTTAFWALYFIDKDLVFPDNLRRAYPCWLNHVMHTFVGVFICIEMFVSNITYPSKFVHFFIGLLYMLSYGSWLLIVYCRTGSWVYPVLGYLNWPARILLMLINFTVSHYFNVFGKRLNKKLSVYKFKSK